MKISAITALTIIAAAAISIYFYANSQGMTTDFGPKGRVQGTVTIGPLCPVEPCDKTADFGKYRLLVKRSDCPPESQSQDVLRCAVTDIATIALNADGTYSSELLPVGSYFVYIDPNIGFTKQSYTFDIEAGKNTTLDLDYDTGIR